MTRRSARARRGGAVCPNSGSRAGMHYGAVPVAYKVFTPAALWRSSCDERSSRAAVTKDQTNVSCAKVKARNVTDYDHGPSSAPVRMRPAAGIREFPAAVPRLTRPGPASVQLFRPKAKRRSDFLHQRCGRQPAIGTLNLPPKAADMRDGCLFRPVAADLDPRQRRNVRPQLRLAPPTVA